MKGIRLASTLGLLSGTNLILAFVYQWYLVTTLGVSTDTDALIAGMVIPQLVLAIASGSLAHVLVPLLSNLDDESFARTCWTLLQAIGLLFITVAVVLMTTAQFWVPWTVPGFSDRALRLTVQLVQIQLIGIPFTAMASVLTAANRSRERFVWVESSAAFTQITGLVLLAWALVRFGIVAAAWILVLKSFLQVLMLVRVAGGYRRPVSAGVPLQVAWKRIRPLLAGSAYYKTGDFVDRFLASMAATGGITLLHLARQIYQAGTSILNAAIVTPMIPPLARAAASHDWNAFRRISNRRLGIVGVATVAAVLLLLVAGHPLLVLIFGRERFGPDEVQGLYVLMLALIGVWAGGTAGQVLSGSFYAQGNTSTPTRVGVFGFTVGIVGKVAGFFLAGVTGIALGTSAYYILNAILLFILLRLDLRRKIGGDGPPLDLATSSAMAGRYP